MPRVFASAVSLFLASFLAVTVEAQGFIENSWVENGQAACVHGHIVTRLRRPKLHVTGWICAGPQWIGFHETLPRVQVFAAPIEYLYRRFDPPCTAFQFHSVFDLEYDRAWMWGSPFLAESKLTYLPVIGSPTGRHIVQPVDFSCGFNVGNTGSIRRDF